MSEYEVPPEVEEIKKLSFRLKTKLEGILGSLDRLLKVGKNAVDSKTDSNFRLFVTMFEDIKLNREKFEDLFEDITASLVKSSPRPDIKLDTIQATFDKKYYEAHMIFKDLTMSHDPSVSSPIQTQSLKPIAKGNIQLPKINLPTFNGDLSQWTSFFELFQALIDKNSDLSDTEKHYYLKSCLVGEPKQLIDSLQVSSANYVAAKDILTKRYQNPRILTNHHINVILDFPALASHSQHALSVRSFYNTIYERVSALKALHHDPNSWSPLLLIILERKIDKTKLFEKWQTNTLSLTCPTIDDFLSFLKDEATILEASNKDLHQPIKHLSNFKSNQVSRKKSAVFATQNSEPSGQLNITCPLCGSRHYLRQCMKFLRLNAFNRQQVVNQHKLCHNCLRPAHSSDTCSSRFCCTVCQGRHHTLLCDEKQLPKKEKDAILSATSHLSFNPPTSTVVLLSTARAQVVSPSGFAHSVRVLLDSASESNFISEDCCRRLGLKVTPCKVKVEGMSHAKLIETNGKTSCSLAPRLSSDASIHIEALIVPSIAVTPRSLIAPVKWPHLTGLFLADPSYNKPGPIDILLESHAFPQILLEGQKLGPTSTPSALNTIFGWTLMGEARSQAPGNGCVSVSTHHISLDRVDLTLRQFWETEEIPVSPVPSPENAQCEQFYSETVTRDPDGRYSVALPFKQSLEPHLATYTTALSRFLRQENALQALPCKQKHYYEAMQDYIQQGHMSPVGTVSELLRIDQLHIGNYVPHLAVLRKGDPPSKVRIVFDASAKDARGNSLNSLLLTGEKLQQDIVHILLNFRLNPFVFLADIRQMFRQIILRPPDRKFQRLLWRNSPKDDLQVYEMNRVMFGVSASPFLALRTIQQLVHDEGGSYPLAKKTLTSSTYVDDVLGSASNLPELICLQDQLITLLSKGGFELGKWLSPHIEILERVPVKMRADNAIVSFSEPGENSVKVLGVHWRPSTDSFSYSVSLPKPSTSKRQLLSSISTIYDPCGWIGPLSMLAKIIMQHTWLLGVEWDQPLPESLQTLWETIRTELPLLSSISIPRYVFPSPSSNVELHAFADASTKGYGGVVYVRTGQPPQLSCHVFLSKSKVAPVKQISLARLELCATVLATKLVVLCRELLLREQVPVAAVTVWSDSTVALHWLRSPSFRWKTYVANRVSQVQTLLSPDHFRHVPSSDNPADCLSRGLRPRELIQHPTWFQGPAWLSKDKSKWPPSPLCLSSDLPLEEEESKPLTLITTTPSQDFKEMLLRFSRLSTLRRVTAYCLRFAHNCRNSRTPLYGPLTVLELRSALSAWIKLVQAEAFNSLLNSESTKSKKLGKLNPFIDSEGIIRVGGRIQHAQASFAKKHPILIPKSHHLTTLIIQHYHYKYLHPGPRTLLALIQESFWIINGKSAVRKVTTSCVKCFRTKPTNAVPLMGNLPPLRVQQAKPFSHVGVDYAGPVSLTMSRLRKARVLKGYLAIFVCLAVKAIHIELVSDLSTDTFIAALRRFIARRGRVDTIVSDCATNFKGASRKLSYWFEVVASDKHNQAVADYLSDQGISWKFIPPSAPHFGGLWEAGVKAVKTLLIRTVGTQLLTFEEYSTVLAQIESVLNSRPLCSSSPDPHDFSALTPGHFLFHEPPYTFAEPNVERPMSLSTRWALVQQIAAHFWKKWHLQYLTELQQRQKWTKATPNLSKGMLVVIKDNTRPPLHWSLGRIVEVHPGDDGVVRVADVRTAAGLFRRPVVKLCPLPSNN